ncbi:MAG: c-type cytochrome biogenesis protein CcsB [Pseudonocardia sp.]|nr:c-type cytochrome biogenesis protein CcsB [Pseudonocardia sp.]
MPEDPMLSAYSDMLFKAALVVYTIAMLMHAVEYVMAKSTTPAAPGASGSATAVAAGAEGTAGSESPGTTLTATATATPPGGGEVVGGGTRSRADRFGRMAVSLTILGVLLHVGAIATRGVAVARWPLGNMYEFASAICLAAVVTWLVVLRRTAGRGRSVRTVGAFVLSPVFILMFLAGTVLYAQAAPVVPALRSYWLVVHVTTVTIASGLMMVAGAASVLYLIKRSGRLTEFAARLPDVEALDRLAYRITVVGFPIYTFAVIAGAIWAEAAWGRFWGWDPKETVAFVAWVVYAAYLHARATAGWRTTGAAWINVLGLATIMFNLFFINMVVAGLHSYAGL